MTSTTAPLRPMDEHNRSLIANVRPEGWRNPVPTGRYNLVVIGGGTAGLVAAAGAAGLGARVALVERHLLGGDCLNVGCVPSKTLIRAARVMAEIRGAERYGIRLAVEPEVDFAAVMERVRAVRAAISPHDSAARFRDLGVDLFFGTARFTGPERIEVDGQGLDFHRALIATGARPAVPPVEGLAEAGYLTNETLFNLTSLPPRLAVVGAGPIGAEMAQAFQRLGSQVTLIDLLPRVLGNEDRDAAALVESRFGQEGMALALGHRLQRVTVAGADRTLHLLDGSGTERPVTVDEILLAVGRVPNSDGLGLDAAGVAFDRSGVTVNAQLQTTNPAVYAAGDVAIPTQFTHAADASARIVVQNALFPLPNKKFDSLTIPWVTYTDPEVAQVGSYEYALAEAGTSFDRYMVPYDEVDRGLTDGESAGFVKILVESGGDRILGATLAGAHAGEMIGEITLAIQKGVGLGGLVELIHPYPTRAGAIWQAANAYNRTRLKPLYGRVLARYFGWRR